MSNKRIIDLEDSNQLDLNDYLAVYNSEPIADSYTFKRKIGDVLGLKTVSVNGKTGNTITINADDISDSATTKKFVTTSEKNKLSIIKTDQGGNTFLAGDGTYKSLEATPQFLEVFMFNYLFQFPNRKYALANSTGSLSASLPTGTTLSGNTRFFWRVSLAENIVPNSVKVYDVNNDTYIITGLILNNQNNQNAGEVFVNLNPIVYNTIQSHAWRIEFTTVSGLAIQSPNLTFNWVG